MSIAFTETEALLIALRGDEDELERYLIENFLPGELRELSRASGMLRAACNDVAEEVARKHGPLAGATAGGSWSTRDRS